MECTQTMFTDQYLSVSSQTEATTGFLYVGRLSQEKGLDLIFEAFAIQKFNLTIIGDGPLKSQVEAFASKYPEVEYLGFQDNKTIRKKMLESSALLFSSRCYEGMPMTILEAFSSGIPVIAASLGSIRDIVRDEVNGLLFSNGNAHDLSAKIQRWIKMPAGKKNHFKHRSLETFQQHFTADINFQMLMDIYQSAIKQASGKR